VGGIGHWRSDAARTRFVEIYDACLSELPAHESVDVATDFGVVRAYRFDGAAGVPVVLLPGRNASTPMWEANLPSLLERRSVYCLDLLGEPGLSVQTREIAGADVQAGWLDEVLAALDLGSVHLAGLSFGGWSAANYAIRRPGRVASLTLLDPVLTFARLPVRTILATLPLTVPGAPERLRRRVLSWLSGGADVDDSVPVARLIDAGSVEFEMHQPTPTLFTDAELSSLDAPVLAVLAGRSVIHDAGRAAERARKTLRHGRVELWPEASHALNGEFPERIARCAGDFWDDVDAGRARVI
jgi:pimeloyl-ACP methyl ester carboxylesterase